MVWSGARELAESWANLVTSLVVSAIGECSYIFWLVMDNFVLIISSFISLL